MPLPIVELRDIESFVEEYTQTIVARDVPASGPQNDVQYGWNMGHGDGRPGAGSGMQYSVYDHIRDRSIFYSIQSKKDPGNTTFVLGPALFARDALCRNASVGWYRDADAVYTEERARRVKVGCPNLATGSQKIYAFNTILDHFEVDPVTGDPTNTNIWPNLSNDFIDSPVATGVEGFFEADDDVNADSEGIHTPLIFEGITSTVGWEPGNTIATEGILRGGTSHPKGLALMTAERANFVGGGSGNNTGRRWFWIDLDTGLAVGVLGIPALSNSASTNAYAESTIDGNSFVWNHIQFVPDDDSTFAQPKGELHISTRDTTAFVQPSARIEAPTGTFTSLATRQYVAVHDFNPFGKTSGTVRVHNRRIFLGLLDQPQEPIIAGGFNATNALTGFPERSVTVTYHPPSRTYFTVTCHPNANPDLQAAAPAAGHGRIIRWRRQAVVSHLSQPTPTSAVTENRTVKARVIASTDLGFRAAGTQLTFTLSRLSTRAESFDGTALGSSNYVVDQGEIDDDGSLDVRSGDDVDGAGTLLVEGVDYTVSSYATGTLAPVGSWPSDTIYVRYRHRSVPVAGGHGTLLSASGTTDGNGQAFALIRYGDNVDGEFDKLEASTS